MLRVLDEDLLAGVIAAELHLRPALQARLLDVDDYEAACSEVELACQLWGGMADLLVPVVDMAALEPYPGLLDRADVDAASGVNADHLVPDLAASPIFRAPALLAIAGQDRAKLRVLEVCNVRRTDPWHLAYLAGLGTLPAVPDATALRSLGLNVDVAFDDVVPVRRVSATAPSADDLVQRLSPEDAFTPRGFSLYGLAGRPSRTMQSALDGWLVDREVFARQIGSAILVVYTPGRVADLCLLWNLRALHGWSAGLPLGIPMSDPEALVNTANDIMTILAGTSNGIVGWPVVLVSTTVPEDVLEMLVLSLKQRGQEADVVTPSDVLRSNTAPSRTSNATLVFDNGMALVPTRTDRDRQDLGHLARIAKPDLRLTVMLGGRKIPLSVVLRSADPSNGSRYSGGGCTVDAVIDTLRDVHWPAGWSLLRAVGIDRGLRVTPSVSGRTAIALLQAIGDLQDVRWLAHRPLLSLLYQKASSSGISWWKTRAKEQAKAVALANDNPQEALAELNAAIDAVSVSHGGESAGTLTFGDLVSVLHGRGPASAWLDWAERRNLVVRGTKTRCLHCQHETWRPLAEISPPMMCLGCARVNERPFNQSSLIFSYRLSELLRRAIENDSIYHLLVMRALRVIVDNGAVPLVGLHPGVDFINRQDEQTEADVVVLFADGDVIPVEIKARSMGLRQHDLLLLDKLSTWLGAGSMILATGDADDQLHPEFVSAARTDPIPLRRLLTAEDWLDPYPLISFGSRGPGPDVCQDGRVVGPRPKSADDLDDEFPAWVERSSPLGSIPDPVGVHLDLATIAFADGPLPGAPSSRGRSPREGA